MKSTHHERLALSSLKGATHHVVANALQSFLLPALNDAIPIVGTLTQYETSNSDFAKTLIAAGVIQPKGLPETVMTPEDIISVGLKQWFDKNLGPINTMEIRAEILDPQAIAGLRYEMSGDARRPIGYSLAIVGKSSYRRTMENKIFELERTVCGLSRTALGTIYCASYRTVEIYTPLEIFNEFAMSYWDADWSTVPTDEEAAESLVDRFGDEDEIPSSYLPSEVVPMFGGDICLQIETTKDITWRKLKEIASSHEGTLASYVAIETLKLKRAYASAKRAGASFPDLSGYEATSTERGLTLMYQVNSYFTEALDMLVECSWNAGDNTDYLGIETLPSTVEEVKQYFKKLKLACKVLRHMDRLIELISQEDFSGP